jgi:predicted nucleotidyltransferase
MTTHRTPTSGELDPRLARHLAPQLEAGGRLLGLGYVGSISHNTHVPSRDPASIDDVDLLGVLLPGPRDLLGLDRWEHSVLQEDELDVTVFALTKLVRLLLGSNPNVLPLLWLRPEHYLMRTAPFDRLLAMRDAFSSRRAHAAYAGYARAQVRDLAKHRYAGYAAGQRGALAARLGFNPKAAAHAIRLLRMGEEFLRTGELRVYRTADAEELRAIKRGEWTLAAVEREADRLFAALDAALAVSPLPPEPDRARAEAFLVETTLSHLREGNKRPA